MRLLFVATLLFAFEANAASHCSPEWLTATAQARHPDAVEFFGETAMNFAIAAETDDVLAACRLADPAVAAFRQVLADKRKKGRCASLDRLAMRIETYLARAEKYQKECPPR